VYRTAFLSVFIVKQMESETLLRTYNRLTEIKRNGMLTPELLTAVTMKGSIVWDVTLSR
jgi:hypothetical protein